MINRIGQAQVLRSQSNIVQKLKDSTVFYLIGMLIRTLQYSSLRTNDKAALVTGSRYSHVKISLWYWLINVRCQQLLIIPIICNKGVKDVCVSGKFYVAHYEPNNERFKYFLVSLSNYLYYLFKTCLTCEQRRT